MKPNENWKWNETKKWKSIYDGKYQKIHTKCTQKKQSQIENNEYGEEKKMRKLNAN